MSGGGYMILRDTDMVVLLRQIVSLWSYNAKLLIQASAETLSPYMISWDCVFSRKHCADYLIDSVPESDHQIKLWIYELCAPNCRIDAQDPTFVKLFRPHWSLSIPLNYATEYNSMSDDADWLDLPLQEKAVHKVMCYISRSKS